ncbi:MAG: RNA polymerase sigma factor [Phycisphaerales bacterium]|nr:RNA polymerase sigma factor [Phycisphaerales bacterium]
MRRGGSAAGSSKHTVAPLTRAPASPAELLADLDTQLMLQVRGGDREAAGQLIRRNYERVSRYIGRIVRDVRAVEDLTQEVFASVLSHAAVYEPTARFTTWVYRVATNTALKFIQSPHVRGRDRAGDARLAETADRVETPDARLTVDELKARVQRAIGELPPNQRAAAILFECEGLSYEQIAGVLNVTEDGVRALLQRARAALRARLSDLLE